MLKTTRREIEPPSEDRDECIRSAASVVVPYKRKKRQAQAQSDGGMTTSGMPHAQTEVTPLAIDKRRTAEVASKER